jgi:hypothetical protein
MTVPGELPRAIRAEVKFTQSHSVLLPARELRALVPTESDAVGVVAALFWCGDDSIDGEWLVVDASDSLVARCTSISASQLQRVCRNQSALQSLRYHVEQQWKPFLAAYFETAMLGYKTLRRELHTRLQRGTLAQCLPQDAILRCEHRAALKELLSVLGPSGTGRVLQRLFAYLLGVIGYRTVTVNAIGVPDVEVSNLIADPGEVNLRTSPEDLARLIRYCREAGDSSLAARLTRHRRDLS